MFRIIVYPHSLLISAAPAEPIVSSPTVEVLLMSRHIQVLVMFSVYKGNYLDSFVLEILMKEKFHRK